MSNATWACFDCRVAMRRSNYTGKVVPCIRCGQPSLCLGVKIRIPRKEAVREWARLRKDFHEGRLYWQKIGKRVDVAQRHTLEKELAKLKSRPDNADRSKLMRLLKQRIEDLK
jgi:hypothetical protein